ncbi:MAG: riboflavin synthase [Patescibacteria group bacterium]
MFTGIIREIGVIKSKTTSHTGVTAFTIGSKKLHPRPGDSIAINGACLTVVKKSKGSFGVEAIAETLKRTNLGLLASGGKVNLEPALKVGDSLDGHMVSGHIDDTVKILAMNQTKKDDVIMTLELPKNLSRFIVEKGSVTLNGVSLTVTSVKSGSFTVALIPYTLKETNLAELGAGSVINLEVDLIARYILKKV